jgi:hypothetical protein
MNGVVDRALERMRRAGFSALAPALVVELGLGAVAFLGWRHLADLVEAEPHRDPLLAAAWVFGLRGFAWVLLSTWGDRAVARALSPGAGPGSFRAALTLWLFRTALPLLLLFLPALGGILVVVAGGPVTLRRVLAVAPLCAWLSLLSVPLGAALHARAGAAFAMAEARPRAALRHAAQALRGRVGAALTVLLLSAGFELIAWAVALQLGRWALPLGPELLFVSPRDLWAALPTLLRAQAWAAVIGAAFFAPTRVFALAAWAEVPKERAAGSKSGPGVDEGPTS